MTRLGYVIATLLAAELFAGLFVGVALIKPHPRFLWNASPSAPIGLYRLHETEHPAIGDLVAIMQPPELSRFMADRDYLPEGLPLLKRIAALPGQWVCRRGAKVTINGKRAATALLRDRRGRSLPVWHGCRTVRAGSLFLINAAPDSLDSRYFGALAASGLIGRAQPVLTRDAPGKPLVWRGLARPSASSTNQKELVSCK
ncbi:S26 family signal peptidase [Novosphingobium sp. BW1]|uniref:S26 family signal peptidase n=1 Tax=Novosphingobium sp. BW1 TaxID=2592621 RepID=UPI0011DEB6B9|nr:S26 family signal peptidase [Novosphingobium sp. BW1]TYC79385.1 S26 family signal peptidase [Novosphingobium sp. BW1]